MAIHSPSGPHPSEPVPPPGDRRLVVTFHDLAPHTQRPCQELLMLLAELGIPRASLFVAPPEEGAGPILERPFFLRWLRSLAEEGHEVRLEAGNGAGEERMLAEAGLPRREVEYALAPGCLYLPREDARVAVATIAFSTRGFLGRAVSPLAGRARFAATRQRPVLRIAVHPGDLYEHRVRRALVSVLQRAVADREPVTYGELARAAVPSQV
jgi:predicted deacetylase